MRKAAWVPAWHLARPGPTILTGAAVVIGAGSALDMPDGAKLVCLAVAAIFIVVGGATSAVSVVFVTLPLVMTQISIGQTEWSPLELALLACWLGTGLVAMGELLANRRWVVLWNFLRPPDLVFLACAFALVGVLSLLWVADASTRSDSVREYRRVILEPLILVPAIALVRRRGDLRMALPWLVVPAALVALLAVGQLLTQSSVVEIGSIARPIGTFTHPNNLAFYLERVAWFAPVALLPGLGSSLKARWGAAGAIVIGCLLTFSRGALIALAAGGVIYFWSYLRPQWRRYLAVVAGVSALTVISRAALGGGDSTDSRMTIWRASIHMLRDHTFQGVGLDQFFGQYGRRYIEPEGWPERYTSHPHNILLDFWLRVGLPGVALLWALIELSTRRIRWSISSASITVPRAAAAMLVAGFVHGLIDNGFFLADLACFAWIGLALSTPDTVIGFTDVD